MSIIIGNLIRSAQKHTSYNVLIYPFDGCFEYYLAKAHPQHTFYRLTKIPKIPLSPTLWRASNNLYDITNNIPPHLTFDFLICNDTNTQYKLAQQLAGILHLPLVIIGHIFNSQEDTSINLISTNQYPISEHRYVSSSLINDVDETKYDVLPYTVLHDENLPDTLNTLKKHQVCLIGHFNQSDGPMIQNLVQRLNNELSLPTHVYNTHTPIHSFPDNKNSSTQKSQIFQSITTQQQYYQILYDSQFYIHLQSTPYIPSNIIHAMAAGCCILANDSPLINKLLTHNPIKNTSVPNRGIIFNGINQLIPTINKTLNNKTANIYGQNAHACIQTGISANSNNNNLNHMFKELINEN